MGDAARAAHGDLGPGASKTVQFTGTVPVDAPLGPHNVTLQCFGTNPSGATTAMSQPVSWQFSVIAAAPQPQPQPQPQTTKQAQPQPQPQPQPQTTKQAQQPASPPPSTLAIPAETTTNVVEGVAAGAIAAVASVGAAAAVSEVQQRPADEPTADEPTDFEKKAGLVMAEGLLYDLFTSGGFGFGPSAPPAGIDDVFFRPPERPAPSDQQQAAAPSDSGQAPPPAEQQAPPPSEQQAPPPSEQQAPPPSDGE